MCAVERAAGVSRAYSSAAPDSNSNAAQRSSPTTLAWCPGTISYGSTLLFAQLRDRDGRRAATGGARGRRALLTARCRTDSGAGAMLVAEAKRGRGVRAMQAPG